MQVQHTYTEAHSDDITAVSFHPSPSLPHVLLSASVDGLVMTYDVRIADEDDAVQSTSQFGASLAYAGWMALKGQEASPEYKGIYGATTIETMQYWNVEEVCSFLFSSSSFFALLTFSSSIQQEQVVDFGDVRDVALQPWRTDYLVGANYNAALGGVCLLAGSIKCVPPLLSSLLLSHADRACTLRGDVAIINASDRHSWYLEQQLNSAGGRRLATNRGHTDIVRTAYVNGEVRLRPLSPSRT